MTISERIFDILKKKGISQKTFSKQTGIAESTISDWKRKKTNPAADKILAISRALDVSVYELLGETMSDKTFGEECIVLERNSEEFAFFTLYRSLRPGDKERMLGYAEALHKLGR